jgi:hypothetical protein
VRCIRERGLSIEAQNCCRFQRLASQPSQAKVACDVELATAGRPSDCAVLRLQRGGVCTNTARQEEYSQTPAVKFRASHRLRGKGRINACRGRTTVGLFANILPLSSVLLRDKKWLKNSIRHLHSVPSRLDAVNRERGPRSRSYLSQHNRQQRRAAARRGSPAAHPKLRFVTRICGGACDGKRRA